MASDQVSALAEEFEDRAALSSRGGSRSGGRGGRFRGGAGGGGGKNREVDISRALSRLLRHQASNAGITLDAEGYAPLDKVLQWPPLKSLSPSFDELVSLVRTNDKQRFTLKPINPALDAESADPSGYLIRANQGHSIKLDNEGLLKPLALPNPDGTLPDGTLPIPETVIHGTYFAFWPQIVASGGLKPMGRNHIHFSTGLPEDGKEEVVSGMRRDAELLVYVDVEGSMREGGVRWWTSENGVVLTGGGEDGMVATRWFREVKGRTQGVGILWRDGKWVADLPEGLKVRVPQGKGRGGGRGRGRGGRGRGRGGRS
ncbi:KptA family-domain-containing protein [Podospora aff. communis PSN243]|uniref:2'-phosphotransferase n=1 Tax=Podospora aff. communis PSN243 TaxID=3040156 RepID=A0AAV9H9L8_9PEZI|nr:KptA family-domain-containing protein [Podospora aff. communis PSN243]